jgi:hypothetical protein
MFISSISIGTTTTSKCGGTTSVTVVMGEGPPTVSNTATPSFNLLAGYAPPLGDAVSFNQIAGYTPPAGAA